MPNKIKGIYKGNKMIVIRKSLERGSAHFDWLDTYYTFSFADYYDQKYLGFRCLRVINEDTVVPAKGFPMHGHRNMEIITYLISGSLLHKDNIGNGSIINAGDVQVMTAGKGIQHSEYNNSNENKLHLLQIWIEPNKKNLEPSYQQKNFSQPDEKFVLLVSPSGERNSLIINQDAKIYKAILTKNADLSYKLLEKRHAWIQVITGRVRLNDLIQLSAGDGVAITEGDLLNFLGEETINHFLLFDLV